MKTPSIFKKISKHGEHRKLLFRAFINIMCNKYLVNTESEINEIAEKLAKNYSKYWYLPEDINLESAKSIIDSDEDTMDDATADVASSFALAKVWREDLLIFASVARREIIYVLVSLLASLSLAVYMLSSSTIPGIIIFLIFLSNVHFLKSKVAFYGASLGLRYIKLIDLCKEAATAAVEYGLESSATDFRYQLLFDKFGEDLFSDEEYDD